MDVLGIEKVLRGLKLPDNGGGGGLGFQHTQHWPGRRAGLTGWQLEEAGPDSAVRQPGGDWTAS